jgi:hypothetical protein
MEGPHGGRSRVICRVMCSPLGGRQVQAVSLLVVQRVAEETGRCPIRGAAQLWPFTRRCRHTYVGAGVC